MATPAAIRADIARVKGRQGDPATVAWFDRHHGGIQNYLAGQTQRLAAAEAAQRGVVPAATVAVDATQQQGHAAKVVTGGGNGRQEILMLFPSTIEQEVRRIHAEGGKVFPQATYAPAAPAVPAVPAVPGMPALGQAFAAPAVPAVPGMPALGQAFAGIGAFINQYAPWLMVIALIYAVGTVLNIGVKAGVGK